MKAIQRTKCVRMKFYPWRICGVLSLIAALSCWAVPRTSLAVSPVSAIAGGEYYSLALKSDGTVWAWGENSVGQLGDGTTINRSNAVQVSGLSGVIAIAAGAYHSLALKSDGTVWAWGANSLGQLGDGTTINRSNAVQASGLSGVIAIAAGQYYSLALKSDGTVWAWGDNNYGQLGEATVDYNPHPTPVQVGGLSGVVAVAAGDAHSLAMKSDGSVWAWGNNGWGQLGNGTTIYYSTPVQASGLSGVIAIAGGGSHSLALKADDTVWAWGLDVDGELGPLGTSGYGPNPKPVLVSDLSGAIAIAGGGFHSLALKSDGTVWAWGGNFYGELGNGTTVSRILAVPVQGLNNPCMTFSVSIEGDATIPVGASKYFSATARFQDGSTKDVSQAAVWTIVGKNYGSSFSGNTLTAGPVSQVTPITIQATYSCGGSLVTSPPMTVTINPQLLASVSILTSYQNMSPNQQIQLSATTVGGSGSSQYQWSLPGSSMNGGLTASSTWVSYPQTGPYLATVTVSVGSLMATATTSVTVNSAPVPNQQPVVPANDPSPGQFRSAQDPTQSFSFDPSKLNNGLIVIVHGMRDSATDPWVKAMADKIAQRIPAANLPNICLYDWSAQADPVKFTVNPYGLTGHAVSPMAWVDNNMVVPVLDFLGDLSKVRPNALAQGQYLADWIDNNNRAGNITYSAPIQIIGHSAGGFVAGECASTLPPSEITQVTMLDTPLPRYLHFSWYPNPGKVERYISAYGWACSEFLTPQTGGFLSGLLTKDQDVWCLGSIFGCGGLPGVPTSSYYYRKAVVTIPNLTFAQHDYAYQWYTQTIDDDSIQDGFYYSPFLGHALPSSSITSPEFADLASAPSGPTLTNIPLTGFSTFGSVTFSNGAYRMVEVGDAGIFATIGFPVGIQSINFSYCFTTPGDGDFLSVHLSTNQVLYVGPDIGVTRNTTNYMNAVIDIPQMAGLTDQLVLKLVSRGSPNAVLTISNITMTVNLDVNHDSVGDGVADWWRQEFFSGQQYFGGDGTTTNGFSCATCDVDGTGQNNMFKYVAGLDPTNPASVFALGLVNTTNQPQTMSLNLTPLALGRHYSPQFSTDLVSGVWLPLPGYSGPVTNGNQVTITDTSAASPKKFYRIDISYP